MIVESPAKAKTIEKYLDNKFVVKSSFGHIRDLAKNGVTIDKLDTHTTSNVHASDKVAAINQYTAQTGVVATGSNAVKISVDLVGATMSEHDDVQIDGIIVMITESIKL